jgi:glycerol-3-phosphate acyltransferase PlsY
MSPQISVLLGAAAAYLLGGFPTGVVVGKLLHNRDIRKLGSGNPGAINVWRVFGFKWAVLVILLDVGKGWLAAGWLPRVALAESVPLVAALFGLLAMMGHIWSPYIRFSGGKGVAAAFGCGLALYPTAALICLALWFVIVALTRYSSVASLTACACYPAAVYWKSEPGFPEIVVSLIIPLLLVFTHRSNLRRLWAGEELKIGHQNQS